MTCQGFKSQMVMLSSKVNLVYRPSKALHSFYVSYILQYYVKLFQYVALHINYVMLAHGEHHWIGLNEVAVKKHFLGMLFRLATLTSIISSCQ